MNTYPFLYTIDINSDTIDNRATCVPIPCISMEDIGFAMEKKLVSFRLPEDLLQGLRDRAAHLGISVTELVSRLLRQGLAEQPDDRIKTLESELNELRQQLKHPSAPNVTHTVLYPLPPQTTPVPYETHPELEQRINQMEAMLKTLVSRITKE